ncbi:MAG TPA: excisionase family DNA-binding protein [Acidimicrobiales bacterium]|nr:excisionase family DNA-binding protein [Acidimicrobiales bacterium]
MRPEKAAEALAIGRTKLYELMAEGAIASVRIGSARRVPTDGLRDFVHSLAPDHRGRHGRGGRGDGAEVVHCLGAIHARHVEVEHHRLGRRLLGDGHAFVGRGRLRHDRVAGRFQGKSQHGADAVCVVHHQHPRDAASVSTASGIGTASGWRGAA